MLRHVHSHDFDSDCWSGFYFYASPGSQADLMVKGKPCFSNLGVPFWGPYEKAYSIWGTVLGLPHLGELPCPSHELTSDLAIAAALDPDVTPQ